MYGEIHRYALHTHHDMHAFPGTHALLGGADYCIVPVLVPSAYQRECTPKDGLMGLSLGECL